MSRVTARAKRTPISGRRNVLTMAGGDTENFVYRIVNDTGDRVAMFEAQGYEVVSDNGITIGDRRVSNPTKEGSPIKVSVGNGVQGYLMRQKKEYFQEDKAAKQKHVDATESSMKAHAKQDSDFGKLEISK